jgi:hypothetical protein
MFFVGCALEIPVVLWFLAFFCVSREEWRRRQQIRKKRKIRIAELGVDCVNDTKLQEEVIATRVVRDIAVKEAKYEIAVAQRNVVSANPMGYPTPGRTRKVHNILPVPSKSKFELAMESPSKRSLSSSSSP